MDKNIEYNKDPRTPCKYGINCYQRNPLHLSKYKHPPRKEHNKNDTVQQPLKKFKAGDSSDTNSSNEGSSNNKNDDLTVPLSTANKNDTVQQPLKKFKPGDSSDTNSSNAGSSNNKSDDLTVPISTANDDEISNDNIADTEIAVDSEVNLNEKDFIKSKFLVDMPPDFYSFWDFCKKLHNPNPLMALNEIGLLLVGPFDVLAGKFKNVNVKSVDEYVLHWRYYFDPPEFQTVIKLNDSSGYHIGYFRDSPEEMPVFLAYNIAKTDGTFTVAGDNLFAAVNSFLEFKKKTANPFLKTNLLKYSNMIQKEADNLKYSLVTTTSKISNRNRQTLAKTFNRLGFIVPYNKRTQLGYRPLTISNKELQDLMNKLKEFTGKERDNLMIKLQEVLTNTNIAIDECDFGTGIELGLDILSSGVESLDSVVGRLLATCYRLLNRETFAVIIESHMKNRKKGFDLSII